MLFFRSEEDIRAWCRERGAEPGPAVSVEQLWRLSVVWYGTRLHPEPPRRTPDDTRAIFAGVGLTDPFWEPVPRQE